MLVKNSHHSGGGGHVEKNNNWSDVWKFFSNSLDASWL